jgi:MFS family permease
MQTISGFFGVLAYVIGATLGNYVLIYVGVGLVFLFSFIPMFFITEDRSLYGAAEAQSAGEQSSTEWGQLMRIYAAHGLSWIGIQTMFVYIIAFIQQKFFSSGADAAVINADSGQIIAIAFAVLNTVGFILPALVLEPIVERIGRVKTHLTCVGLMSVAYFGMVLFAHTPLALYLLMAVAGIGWAAVVSLPFAIMTEKIDKGRTGFFMGIFNLSVVLPQLLVSLIVGTVIKNASDKNIIFLISGVSLACSAVLWGMVKEQRHAQSGGSSMAHAQHAK